MKSALLVIAACFAWLAAAGVSPYYITAPLSGAMWVINTTSIITWKEGTNETITINLIEGDNSASMVPTGHYFTVNGARGSATWKVPAGLDTNGDYAIRIDYTDQSTGQVVSAFSGAFKVIKNDPNTTTTTTTTKSRAASASTSLPVTAISTHPASSARSSAHSPTTGAAPSASLPPNLRPSLAASTTPEVFMSSANTRYAMAAATFSIVPFIVASALLV